MPVKWTADKDQLLLTKILETHEIKVEPKKILAAWPAEAGERPTPRAISERIVAIRKKLAEGGKGGTTTSPSSATPKKVPTTPQKTLPDKNGGDSSTSTRKRKHEVDVKTEDDDTYHGGVRIPRSELAGLGLSGNGDSPTKRARRTAMKPVKYAASASDDGSEDDTIIGNGGGSSSGQDGDDDSIDGPVGNHTEPSIKEEAKDES